MNELVRTLRQLDAEGPAREMWTAAAVREVYRPEDLLTSWLEAHPKASSDLQQAAVQVAIDLSTIGGQRETFDRASGLQLPSEERRYVLEEVGAEEAQRVLSTVPDQVKTITERMLESLLSGDVDVTPQDRQGLTALASALGWAQAAGITSDIASDEVQQHLGRLEFLETLAGSDLHRFVGRKSAIRLLRDAYVAGRSRPFLIEGPGGIGKTLMVARFIADILEEDARVRPTAVFHIDFDRLALAEARPATILQVMAQQASHWWGATESDELQALAREVSYGAAGLESIGQSRNVEVFIDERTVVRRLLAGLPRTTDEIRILIFVDSFEQVETFDSVAAEAVSNVAAAMQEEVKLFTVYASRVFANPVRVAGLGARPMRLSQFSVAEADEYLANEVFRAGIRLSRGTIAKVRRAVGRSPLALRLAVALIPTDGGPFNEEDWPEAARQSPERMQAVLYDRVLRRVRDPELRKIARPGLLVRRITAEVIRAVLAVPCQLDLDTVSPEDLMLRAGQEGQLFVRDASDPGALRHRQDVRSLILPDLDRTIDAHVARDINRRAIAYYKASGSTDIDRAEELYHRLRLSESPAEVDSRWTDAAGRRLKPIVDELPESSRRYVRSKLGSLSIADEVAAEPLPKRRSDEVSELRVAEIRQTARRLLQSGQSVDELVTLLADEGMESLTGPLGDIVSELLIRHKRFEELLRGAELVEQRSDRRSQSGIDPIILANAAGVAEGRGDLGTAARFWDRAVRLLDDRLDPVEQLGPLIGSIRILRKTAGDGGRRAEELRRARAIVVEDQRIVGSRRVLAREAAAELGELLLRPDAMMPERWLRSFIANVLDFSDAFPSAVDDKSRLRDLSHRLGAPRGFGSAYELGSFLAKSMYEADTARVKAVIDLLRDEVDWTLSHAVQD